MKAVHLLPAALLCFSAAAASAQVIQQGGSPIVIQPVPQVAPIYNNPGPQITPVQPPGQRLSPITSTDAYAPRGSSQVGSSRISIDVPAVSAESRSSSRSRRATSSKRRWVVRRRK